jgi:CDP-6-deoxy-D-xylo-4-hexulose-3-dehydrase
MLRSHGMVRESTSNALKQAYQQQYPECNPEFIFAFPAFNVRSTELNAVIGRSQLKRLDDNNEKRRENLKTFLQNLDPAKYRTDFETEESCNYAFTLVLREANPTLAQNVVAALKQHNVEFRRGLSGGGSMVRQPFLRKIVGENAWKDFPNVDHVHFYGWYIGNYPDLAQSDILALCEMLNAVPAQQALRSAA